MQLQAALVFNERRFIFIIWFIFFFNFIHFWFYRLFMCNVYIPWSFRILNWMVGFRWCEYDAINCCSYVWTVNGYFCYCLCLYYFDLNDDDSIRYWELIHIFHSFHCLKKKKTRLLHGSFEPTTSTIYLLYGFNCFAYTVMFHYYYSSFKLNKN